MLLAADVSGDTDTQLLQPVAVEVALDSDVASGSGFVAGDANGDGLLQPIDVLLIINAVNADGEMTLMAGDPMDVNVDGWLTLDDASVAIAHLAAAMSTPSGSPQPTVEPQAYDYDSSDTVDTFAASASSSMEPDTEPSASTSFSFVPSPSFEPTPSPSDEPTPSPSPLCLVLQTPTPSPASDPIGAPDATPNDDGPARVPDWPVLNAIPPGQLHDGMTEFEMGGKYGVGRYTITRQLECVPLKIEYHAALSAIDAEITVEFKNGWIFKHSAIPQARLLKHEQLHWSMAVYIAEKFDAIAKDVWATGTGVAEHEAKSNARMWANMKLDEINALHVSFQQRIQSRYDAETNGGELPQPGAFDHQLDWEATWQRKIDIDFDVYKNDHPELQPLPI